MFALYGEPKLEPQDVESGAVLEVPCQGHLTIFLNPKTLVSQDTSSKELVKPGVTQEVAQVSKGRSGGSAQVKVKRRELQMQSANMWQSFSCVCRMFYFGSNHLFQHDRNEHEPNRI